jgi:serine/threonine-protein kinase RsbW
MGFEKVAMSTAASVAKLMGFREDRIEDLKTAVAEACINAIEHGNRLNEKLSVGVVLRPVLTRWKSRSSTTARA